jgi:hypothetical protein
MIRSLRLDRMGNRGEAALVPALDALAASASGRRMLPRVEARWLFVRACSRDGDMLRVRSFAAEACLVDDLWRVCDRDLRELVLRRIDRGDLVALSLDSEPPGEPVAAERRRLADDIDSALAGRELWLGGGTYTLILGADLARLPDRRSFVALPRPEAARLLLAKQPRMADTLRALLERARELLAETGPVPAPDRFVLLRRAQRVARSVRVDEPALTPSQLRESVEKTWIEIKVAFDDGEPYSGSVEVGLADGKVVTATTNARGILRLDGIVPGTCKVRIPEIDAADWSPA